MEAVDEKAFEAWIMAQIDPCPNQRTNVSAKATDAHIEAGVLKTARAFTPSHNMHHT